MTDDIRRHISLVESQIFSEARVIRVEHDSTNTEMVWMNPTASDMKSLLSSREAMRGLLAEGDIYVWDAYNAIHYTMFRTLQSEGLISLGEMRDAVAFIISADQDFHDDEGAWADGDPPDEINGFKFYGGDKNSPAFQRMLGIRQPVNEYKTIWATHAMVYRSPTTQETKRLVERFKQVRGTHVGGKLYMWPADEAIHFQVERDLGIANDEPDHFEFYLSDVKWADEDWWEDRMRKCPSGFFWATTRPVRARRCDLFRKVLGYDNPVTEAVRDIQSGNNFARVYENPTRQVMINLIGRIIRRTVANEPDWEESDGVRVEFRGLAQGDDFFVWETWNATHYDVAKELHLDPDAKRTPLVDTSHRGIAGSCRFMPVSMMSSHISSGRTMRRNPSKQITEPRRSSNLL